MKKYLSNIYRIVVVAVIALCVTACKDDEEAFSETRLFRPVLNEELSADGNSIIVNMANMKRAVSYTLEISRDNFETIDYTIQSDTSYVVINDELLAGDPLFWNTLYQVRATAHADKSELDSKVSDLGSVRTDRFPTILNVPASYDVTDVAARVTWEVAGQAVTSIKLFAASDLKLLSPLAEIPVSEAEAAAGEAIVTGLTPDTDYQIAIYSDGELRGWVNYETFVADIDPTSPGVIDIRDSSDPNAVINAVATAPDASTILIKRGVTYNMPTANLDKSITIRAAYGFGRQKAKLYTTTNWNIAGSVTIDHIRFIDVELRGDDYAGDYVFNPNVTGTTVNEISFDNCDIGTFRGILRVRGTILVNNFSITNSIVDSLGSYGILTTDTDPNAVTPTARVLNIALKQSTFNKIQAGITSRNNSTSITIEDCTFSNFVSAGSGNYIFRYRGGVGNNDVTGGISITNSIFGPGWDEAGANLYAVRGKDGLLNTPINIVNTYSTSEFAFIATYEIPGFPVGTYTKKQADLWVSPSTNDFNFKDTGFAGKYDSGDPRWRVEL